VTVTDQAPQLVLGLSGTLIQLESGLPPAVPLKDTWGENAAVVLRRGPNSADSGMPLMVALEDTAKPDGSVPRAIVSGMPVDWLPEADAIQLVRNMVAWMLSE
jgi:hypothetical protein